MSRRANVGLLVLATVVLSACGIANDSVPRDIPDQQRSPFLDAPVQATASAAGTDRIFLLAPELPNQPRHLRATPRDVGASATVRLQSLFGPLSVAETTARLHTAIPDGLKLRVATLQTNGTLIVDVTDQLLSLSSSALIDAVAQIVFTALEVRNVQRVELLVNGISQQWPGGDGALRNAPLTSFDFPGLIETTQPNFPAVPSPTP
jgi:hypothetical protein